ncbi:thiopeptide-type bacteriocin biosynthesis protein [Saccharopolyspora cebuensis]|uniref:Thiopeptide-type bacteriocin biosynthesis protein n=1 Tax=Saccharopolyspora cebuensis TaxID=418759 RepID=A0ABV4CM72_9PSEU
MLVGTPLTHAAAQVGMGTADLAEAIAAYRSAGRAALDVPAWWQVRIRFRDWAHAETRVAQVLAPELDHAVARGVLRGWWYIRKYPCWRLRFQLTSPTEHEDAKRVLAAALDRLIEDDAGETWWSTPYEPETVAFGGPCGVDLAHRLFALDTHHFLTYLRNATGAAVGRHELSLLLLNRLFQAARLDDHERGDVWHRVVQARPMPTECEPERLRDLAGQVGRLFTANPTHESLGGEGGPLGFAVEWFDEIADVGSRLADAARDGHLERGVRAVLAKHVIFHWNRFGIETHRQARYARAARAVLLDGVTS